MRSRSEVMSGVRGEQIVGQDFPVGQREDRQPRAAEETQLRVAAFKFARIRSKYHIEALVGARRLRKRQRRRAAVELAPLEMRVSVGRDGWF